MWARLQGLPRRVLMAAVRGYRFFLKPWLGNACRFEPTCSAYALQALQRHGALAGSALTGWRLLRCQPWCDGGCDPVPERLSNPAAGLFTRLCAKAPDAPPPTRNLP
ncbi:membrane protein insertion efficiency factor YidD [Rubrivivax sp. A210]|uniref:membrane protein insertion efficiency factor YidD n=1 Tax=Rubrivivax sp. A210 TaxID=2772301 RepID=UPI0019184718|nr:membrane protein insertion efficiency factor YidD [Rubrivivax sp. A210]